MSSSSDQMDPRLTAMLDQFQAGMMARQFDHPRRYGWSEVKKPEEVVNWALVEIRSHLYLVSEGTMETLRRYGAASLSEIVDGYRFQLKKRQSDYTLWDILECIATLPETLDDQQDGARWTQWWFDISKNHRWSSWYYRYHHFEDQTKPHLKELYAFICMVMQMNAEHIPMTAEVARMVDEQQMSEGKKKADILKLSTIFSRYQKIIHQASEAGIDDRYVPDTCLLYTSPSPRDS